MTETLHIRLLGDFSVMLGENPLDTFHKPRLQALLAYLVLHRGAPQFRHHLANLLWPDSAETQAYTNLRNLVYLLRQALPDAETFLRADSQTLRWVENAPYTLDVLDFSRALEMDGARELPQDCLEKAVQCYGGDLLPSCYDSWIILERGRLRQQFLTALDELAACLEGQRCYPDAIRYNRRLVEADPLHPGGYPRLMRLLALNGEQPAALKAYRDYARVLRKELGIEPDAEVQNLYLDLKEQGRPREFPGEPGDLLPLVGRHAEWQAMQAQWKTASGGAPRMLWLRGEAGIGKTRLVEELVLWAGRQGIHTRVARSYPSEGRLPYAPVISWLRARRLPPLEKVWLVELSRLLPELSKEKPAPLTEAWQRLRLFEALARAMLGNRQCMILLIEDLQWCDQDTLEWLHYLLRFDARARLLLVGTVRSEEEDANPALARLRSALQQEGFSLELEPGRLDEAETGHLAALVSGKALSPGVGQLLYQETEGNPLFIVETMRAEMNKQAHLPGVQPLPYKARAVLQNRIGQLSPGARELVNLAATIGREFSLPVLRQASSAGEEQMVRGLDELIRRRIVRELAPGVYDFSHDKLREATLTGLGTAHVQLLHRQAAEALLQLNIMHAFGEDKNGEIAGHYEHAGIFPAAFYHYRIAGESARGIFANDLAIRYFQRALDLLADQTGTSQNENIAPPQEIAGLYEQMGDVLSLAGRYPQAQQAYQLALTQEISGNPIWQSSIYRRISVTQESQGQLDKAHDSLFNAATVLGPFGNQTVHGRSPEDGTLEECREWIDIQFARTQLFYWQNRASEMEQILERVRPYVDTVGRADQRIDFLGILLDIEGQRTRYRLSSQSSPQLMEIARQKLKLSQELGTPYQVGYSMFQLGFFFLWSGCLDEAGPMLEQAVHQAEKIQAMTLLVRCLAYLCICRRMQGDARAVRPLNERLMEAACAICEGSYTGVAWGNRAWLAWLEGDFDKAVECGQTAVTTWRQVNSFIVGKWTAYLPLMAVAISRGQQTEAIQTARVLLDPGSMALADPLPTLLTQAIQVSDRQICLALLEQALAAAKKNGYL